VTSHIDQALKDNARVRKTRRALHRADTDARYGIVARWLRPHATAASNRSTCWSSADRARGRRGPTIKKKSGTKGPLSDGSQRVLPRELALGLFLAGAGRGRLFGLSFIVAGQTGARVTAHEVTPARGIPMPSNRCWTTLPSAQAGRQT